MSSSLTLVQHLLDIFDKPCDDESRILQLLRRIQRLPIDETLSDCFDQLHLLISHLISEITAIRIENANICKHSHIQQCICDIFVRYYSLIISMPKAVKYSNVDNDNNEEEKTQNTASTKLRTNVSVFRVNDRKWQILGEIVEHLTHHLWLNGIIQSEFIWNAFIQRTVMQYKNTQLKRTVITLSRILLCFGGTFIQQNQDKSLLDDIQHCIKRFLTDFVSINYKLYTAYNDYHTLSELDMLYQLLSTDAAAAATGDHVVNHTANGQQRAKKRKRGKKKKTKSHAQHKLVSQQMEEYYQHSRVCGLEQQNKHELMQHIGRLWKKTLFSSIPSLKAQIDDSAFDEMQHIQLFGSSATKLDERGADIDLYLTTPAHLALSISGEWQLFQTLSRHIQSAQYQEKKKRALRVVNIFNCTVPIIKIQDETNDIKVDISFGKQAENTAIVHLLNRICGYNEDARIRQLIVAIKYWSKQRDLNDGQRNRLSSFGFVLLTIKYLQTLKIVPLLRKKRKTETKRSRSCNHNEVELEEVDAKRPNQHHKQLSLAQLLLGFFEFYSEFEYHHYAVSLFRNKVIKKNRRYVDLNGTKLKEQKLVFVIEDPIQSNYNCSKNLREYTVNLMRIEFLRAKILLKHANADFYSVCKDVRSLSI